MSRKPVAPWFIVLVLLFALSVVPTYAQETITLQYAFRWAPNTVAGDTIRGAMAEYSRLNPHVNFEVVFTSGGVAHYENYLVLCASVGCPDISHFYSLHVPDLITMGLLTPAPEDVAARLHETVIPGALDLQSYGGRVYGFPTAMEPAALAFNRRILEEGGYTTPDGWDWTELEHAAQRLTRHAPDGVMQQAGLTLARSAWVWTAKLVTLIAGEGGEFITEDGELRFHSAAGLRALERIIDWYTTAGFATGSSSLWDNGNGAFRYAFPHQTRAMIALEGAQFSDAFGVSLMPAGSADRASYQYTWGQYVAAGSKHQEEAWKFLEFLSTQGASGVTPMGEALIGLGNLSPFRVDLMTHPYYVENLDYWTVFANNMAIAVHEGQFPDGQVRQDILRDEVEAALRGDKTPRQALDDAVRAIQPILDRYR